MSVKELRQKFLECEPAFRSFLASESNEPLFQISQS